MTRQNLFSDDLGRRRRRGHRNAAAGVLAAGLRPDGRDGLELAPGAREGRLHMHFGAEEMFFVLIGPTFQAARGRGPRARRLRLLPRGKRRPARVQQPRREEPAQVLALSAGGFPDVVAYPEDGYAWVATGDPDPELLARADDPGDDRPLRDPDPVTTATGSTSRQRRGGRAGGLLASAGLRL